MTLDLYAENVLDHFRHPRGKLAVAAPTVTRKEENLSCGDGVTLSLRIEENRIAAVGWEGQGCAISQAGMSMLAEELAGKSVAEAETLTVDRMKALLGVPVGPRRFKCALLGLHALRNALRLAEGKPAQSWTETVGVDDSGF